MKKLVSFFLVFAIFAMQCTNSAGSMRPTRSLRSVRAAENATADQDTGIINMLGSGVGMMESLPGVGGGIKYGVTFISDTMYAVQDLTNGGAARVLGGALPCVISLENGIKCTGITDENNIATLMMDLVDVTPMPGLAKFVIRVMLEGTANPIANGLFGGVVNS